MMSPQHRDRDGSHQRIWSWYCGKRTQSPPIRGTSLPSPGLPSQSRQCGWSHTWEQQYEQYAKVKVEMWLQTFLCKQYAKTSEHAAQTCVGKLKSNGNETLVLLVDMIYSLLHASNQLHSASQTTIFKGKFGCLSRKDDVKEVKIRPKAMKISPKQDYNIDLLLEDRR